MSLGGIHAPYLLHFLCNFSTIRRNRIRPHAANVRVPIIRLEALFGTVTAFVMVKPSVSLD